MFHWSDKKRTFIEWVFRIRFQEQELEAINDGVDCQNRFPVLSK
jgi:hypothetical protein